MPVALAAPAVLQLHKASHDSTRVMPQLTQTLGEGQILS